MWLAGCDGSEIIFFTFFVKRVSKRDETDERLLPMILLAALTILSSWVFAFSFVPLYQTVMEKVSMLSITAP